MPPLGSCVTDQLAAVSGGRPPRALVAYGSDDDPLRLTVLLADHLRRVVAHDWDDDVQVCLDPKAGWRSRLSALRALLSAVPASEGRHAALIDVDAIHGRESPDWDEQVRRTPGNVLFELLVESPGLWLVRTSPTAAVTRALEQHGVDEVQPTSTPSAMRAFAAFAPECRDAARWLVAQSFLRERDLDDIVDQVREFDDHILTLAYSALSQSARRSAAILSAVRAPSRKNGGFGPLLWTQQPSPQGVPREDVEKLAACGFLRMDDPAEPAALRMPRRVRRVVGPMAALDPSLVKAVHAHVAAGDFENQPLEAQLEIHHHAVGAGDIERAKSTARFYGVELRNLALRLSVDGCWEPAAGLYRHVIDTFDREDPFVWEYWAFNLARWDYAEHCSGRHEPQIREGYDRADALTKRKNPLYRGRLLGYRAERGDDVSAEFHRGMTTLLRDYAGQEDVAISRYADAVLSGLKRSGKLALRRTLCDQWKTSLERFAPRVIDKHEG